MYTTYFKAHLVNCVFENHIFKLQNHHNYALII